MVIKELVASRKQEKEEATPDPLISLLFPSSLATLFHFIIITD